MKDEGHVKCVENVLVDGDVARFFYACQEYQTGDCVCVCLHLNGGVWVKNKKYELFMMNGRFLLAVILQKHR